MEWFLIWIGGAILAGVIAAGKGRSGFGFFLLAVVLSPLVGVIAALVAQSKAAALTGEALEHGLSKEYRKCPFCAEAVRREALICRYCQRELPKIPKSTPDSDAARLGYALGSVFRKKPSSYPLNETKRTPPAGP